MILGTPKFTGLAIGELTINKMAPTTKITAKVAFIDPATGITYGWTTAEGALWSKDTLDKLNELLTSMEADVARIHFEGGSGTEPAIAPGGGSGPIPAGGGLGEHLGTGADASSI